MVTIILHIIAAALWMIAIFMAATSGACIQKKEEAEAKVGLALVSVIAITAFTTQVIA